MIKASFIPVAVDNHHIEKQRDAEGDFYRKVASRQGEYIFTADARILGSTNTHSPGHIVEMMKRAIAEYRPAEVSPVAGGTADPNYHRAPPEGGAILYVTTKVLGGYEPPKDKMTELFHESLGRDHIWVDRNEVQELISGKVADSLKRRMACFHLMDNTRGEPAWWNPDEMRRMELVLSSDGRMRGSVQIETSSGDRGFQAELLGFWSVKNGRLARFDLAAKGEAWGETRYNAGAPKGRYPVGIAFSLTEVKDDGDKVLPQGACRGNFGRYFGR